MIVFVFVYWHKSRSRSCLKEKISASFERVGKKITYDFVYFYDLEQPVAQFFCNNNIVFKKNLLFKQVLAFDKMS